MSENSANELQMRIEEKYRTLSKGQKRLAEYVLDNYDKAVFLTAAKLGEVVGVSESTVVRFATQLGYKGYPGFQMALEELVRNKLNSIQRMKVTYGRISQSEILETVLQSDIEKIKQTLTGIDQSAFEQAIDTILHARKIYVIGIRSCAPLASFMSFYLNLICDNVIAVNTNSSSEIFEQIIRIGEEDVIIGISFPRYSMRTLKALEFASKRKAKGVNSMIKPLHKFVLIKKEEKENKTTSGIVLSTEKKEVPSIASVIAVGDECTSSLKENDRVIYKEYSGTKVTVDDQDYIVIDEKDIIAKFE